MSTNTHTHTHIDWPLADSCLKWYRGKLSGPGGNKGPSGCRLLINCCLGYLLLRNETAAWLELTLLRLFSLGTDLGANKPSINTIPHTWSLLICRLGFPYHWGGCGTVVNGSTHAWCQIRTQQFVVVHLWEQGHVVIIISLTGGR